MSYNNNKFEIWTPTWNDQLELPDASYSVSDIQDYFEYIFKEYGENWDNPSVKTYAKKIENRIAFKIKAGYYLELLTPKTMKLLGSTKNKRSKDKNGENVPHLEITEVVLVHFNFVNNHYQQDSRVLDKFVRNKPFDSLLEIFPKIISFYKHLIQYAKALKWRLQIIEIENRIELTLVIK